MSRRYADSGDEQTGARLNDNVDKLVQLSLGVVIAFEMMSAKPSVYLFEVLLCLPSAASDLGYQQIDTKRCLLVC